MSTYGFIMRIASHTEPDMGQNEETTLTPNTPLPQKDDGHGHIRSLLFGHGEVSKELSMKQITWACL